MDTSLNKLWGMVKDREAWHAKVHGVTKLNTTEWLETTYIWDFASNIAVHIFHKTFEMLCGFILFYLFEYKIKNHSILI